MSTRRAKKSDPLDDVPLVPLGDTPNDTAATDGDGAGAVHLPRVASPEFQTNFMNRATTWFFNPVVRAGYKKPLDPDDLYELAPRDTSRAVSEKFVRAWDMTVTMGKPSLTRAFNRSLGPYFYVSAVHKAIHDALQFVNPVLLKFIIRYVSCTSDSCMNDWLPWQGWMLAAGILLSTMFQSLLINVYFVRTYRTGMHMRTGVIAAVYQKALRLSMTARQTSSSGNVVNLMSSDAQKLGDLFTYLHTVWSGPLQIIIAFALLFWEVNWSALAGLATMAALLPLNGVIANRLSKIRAAKMAAADSRVKWTNEVLQGIKSIKLYAWEGSFLQKLLGFRSEELRHVRSSAVMNSVSAFLFAVSPVLVSIVTFVVFAASGNELTAESAFVTMSLLGIMRFPIAVLPGLVNSIAEVKVSARRMRAFLTSEEVSQDAVERLDAPALGPSFDTKKSVPTSLILKNASFTWRAVDAPAAAAAAAATVKTAGDDAAAAADPAPEPVDTLRNLSLSVPTGALVLIVGRVGSGKTSLLSAITNEMRRTAGSVTLCGRVAYVAQEAWIQNMSVRDNIVFGFPFNDKHYQRTIEACALTTDLEMLPAGDATEIGERGINLSGGQKQRVNLARAVFSDADVVLMDDCLSAVDAHVGKHIFDQCIMGVLQGKTRIVATHQLQFLPQADWIVMLEDGQIKAQGTYTGLQDAGINFAALALDDASSDDEAAAGDEQPRKSSLSDGARISTPSAPASKPTPTTPAAPLAAPAAPAAAAAGAKPGARLTTEEERETGSVSRRIYGVYMRAGGSVAVFALIILVGILGEAVRSGSTGWLSYWSSSSTGPEPLEVSVYVGVYTALGIGTGLFALARSVFMSLIGVRAARRLHERLARAVLRAPMSFMDQTPTGRLINRFTSDTDTVDSQLATMFNQFLNVIFTCIGSLILILSVNYFFVVAIGLLAILYVRVQQYYRRTSRELKRIQSISRSPIFVHFSETMSGLNTIRAYNVQDRFRVDSEQRVDRNNESQWAIVLANRWLSLRLEFVGNLVAGGIAIVIVGVYQLVKANNFESLPGLPAFSASLAGMSLSNALAVTGWLNWLVRMSTEFEMAMNSVERINHYISVPSEAPLEIEETRPPSTWPSKGAIEFRDLTIRYRDDLPAVLKGLKCSIKGGEKVGIVGRTGAGKTTFVQSLFRLVEASEGKLLLDDIDVSTIGLQDLRGNLSIVPQDPVLFTGTLRENLDPFGKYSDASVWAALECVQLKEVIGGLEGKLDARVSEGGQNFSVGQRQLMCLARALLRDAKVLVMDEATANIDTETDAFIQETIRKSFKHCTVLTIAHRLNTIIDSDRVMVLDKGQIVEFDHAHKLLGNSRTIFSSMIENTGAASATYLRAAAKAAFMHEVRRARC